MRARGVFLTRSSYPRSAPRRSASPGTTNGRKHGPALMSREPHSKTKCHLVAVNLDENSIGRSNRDVEHERAVAIYDLLEDNFFAPGDVDGPFALNLSITGSRLMFDIRREDGTPVIAHLLSLSPLRRIVKDYFTVCDSYYEAIRTATPDRIEALDMARRALHDEGSQILMERLKRKVNVDFDTARRLFTLVCVLHWKG
jgi:uncharacterized protein (UPF0262 family)